MLVTANENKEKIKRYEEQWSKIMDLITSITKKSDDYDEKYMKIKFNSDEQLPLNNTTEIPGMRLVVRTNFPENNKYYPQFFLEECLHKLNIKMLYIMAELMLLKKLLLIKQMHQKSVIFITIGISGIMVLSFNQMSAIDVMIY